MSKKQKKILVLAIIVVFMVTALFLPGLTDAGWRKPWKPLESIMTMLDEIYDIVLDTNSKVTPASCTGAPVEKTGQTESYDAGDDGDLEKGKPWPNPRFTDNSDGTVTDNLTGLVWLKNASCDGAKTWVNALGFANSLYDGWTGDDSGGDCGLTDSSIAGDWRLPNVKELQSLVDYSRTNPTFPEIHPFDELVAGRYWSSTTYALGGTLDAWRQNFYFGDVNHDSKSVDFYVWPVRDGN